jgi:hypothetical protein
MELVVTVSVFDEAGREIAIARLDPRLRKILDTIAFAGAESTVPDLFGVFTGQAFSPEIVAPPAPPDPPAPEPTSEPLPPAIPPASEPAAPATGEPEAPAGDAPSALAAGTQLRITVPGASFGSKVRVRRALTPYPGYYSCEVLDGPEAGTGCSVGPGQYEVVEEGA